VYCLTSEEYYRFAADLFELADVLQDERALAAMREKYYCWLDYCWHNGYSWCEQKRTWFHDAH